mmetsp:Transcript_133605/g.415490  ORF Transcript_133605/g.415490 Transcript_133605/m.415490 type:complete len:289 (-) Transcript_133605:549-1415(-)
MQATAPPWPGRRRRGRRRRRPRRDRAGPSPAWLPRRRAPPLAPSPGRGARGVGRRNPLVRAGVEPDAFKKAHSLRLGPPAGFAGPPPPPRVREGNAREPRAALEEARDVLEELREQRPPAQRLAAAPPRVNPAACLALDLGAGEEPQRTPVPLLPGPGEQPHELLAAAPGEVLRGLAPGLVALEGPGAALEHRPDQLPRVRHAVERHLGADDVQGREAAGVHNAGIGAVRQEKLQSRQGAALRRHVQRRAHRRGGAAASVWGRPVFEQHLCHDIAGVADDGARLERNV